MPKYSKLQFIAYESATLALSASGTITAAVPSSGADPLVDARNMTNVDARNRLLRFYQVIENARTTQATHLGGSDTLKVCVAPEFYFRDATSTNSLTGNYDSYGDPAIVTNIVAALSAMFKQDAYKDWLIVPGSIFWNQKTPAVAYFNTVSVVRGRSADFPSGTANPAGVPIVRNATTNQKALMSHIDYYYDPTNKTTKIDKKADDAALNPYFSPIMGDWPFMKGHMFEVSDITGPNDKPLVFGLEVCLEHAAHYAGATPTATPVSGGVLKHTLADWSKHETGSAPAIDIHIVTACGMPIQPTNVCAKANGYVLWCDGYPDTTARSAIRKVTANGTGGATMDAAPAQLAQADVPGPLQLNNGGTTQTVRIYPAVNLST